MWGAQVGEGVGALEKWLCRQAGGHQATGVWPTGKVEGTRCALEICIVLCVRCRSI